MSLNHDKDGFLLASETENDSDKSVEISARALEIWEGIKGDTAAMRSSLSKQASEAAKPSTQRGLAPVMPIRASKQNIAQIERITAGIVRGIGKDGPRQVALPAATPARDAGGRFLKTATPAIPGKGSAGNGSTSNDSNSHGGNAKLERSAGLLGDAADKIMHVTDGAETLDPTIAAANEVKGIVAPVAGAVKSVSKGIWGFFRRDKGAEETKKTIPWFRRMWGELRALNRKDMGGGGGLMGMLSGGLGGLLSKIPGFGLLSSVFGRLGGMLSSMAGGFRPLLGFLAKLALPLTAIYSAFQSFSKTTEQYAEMLGVTAGEGLLKDLGIRFVGVLGDLGNTLTFGLAGKFGELISPAVGMIVDRIGETWEKGVAQFTALWEGTTTGAAAVWTWYKDQWQAVINTATQTWDLFQNFLKSKLGIDTGAIKQKAGIAADSVKTSAGNLWDGAKNVAGKAVDGVKNLVGGVIESGKGYNVVQRPDGSVEKQEGARNWRNNNPGNIEYGDFAKKQGAIGSDGRFAVFPSYEAGRGAKENLIFGGANYKDKNLTDAIARYAPPGENNTAAYQKAVLDSVGGSNKRMADYTPAERKSIMDAMEKVEGYKVGKVTTLSPATANTVAALPPASAKISAAVPATARTPSAATDTAAFTPPPTPSAAPSLIGSGGFGDKAVTVNMAREVGQNVSDRGVAQITTGGLGGYKV